MVIATSLTQRLHEGCYGAPPDRESIVCCAKQKKGLTVEHERARTVGIQYSGSLELRELVLLGVPNPGNDSESIGRERNLLLAQVILETIVGTKCGRWQVDRIQRNIFFNFSA